MTLSSIGYSTFLLLCVFVHGGGGGGDERDSEGQGPRASALNRLRQARLRDGGTGGQAQPSRLGLRRLTGTFRDSYTYRRTPIFDHFFTSSLCSSPRGGSMSALGEEGSGGKESRRRCCYFDGFGDKDRGTDGRVYCFVRYIITWPTSISNDDDDVEKSKKWTTPFFAPSFLEHFLLHLQQQRQREVFFNIHAAASILSSAIVCRFLGPKLFR